MGVVVIVSSCFGIYSMDVGVVVVASSSEEELDDGLEHVLLVGLGGSGGGRCCCCCFAAMAGSLFRNRFIILRLCDSSSSLLRSSRIS